MPRWVRACRDHGICCHQLSERHACPGVAKLTWGWHTETTLWQLLGRALVTASSLAWRHRRFAVLIEDRELFNLREG